MSLSQHEHARLNLIYTSRSKKKEKKKKNLFMKSVVEFAQFVYLVSH